MGSDEEVVGASQVRKLEARIRELERQLKRKTLEVEILKEALAARLKRCGGGKRGAELLTRGFAGYRHLSPGNGSVSPLRERLQKLTHCLGALGPGH